MALFQSKFAKGGLPIPYPAFAGAVVAQRFHYDIAAAPAANDVFEIACLPAGCRVIEITVDSDDMDSGAGLSWDVGILSGVWGTNDSGRTCGNEFYASLTLSQAGGIAPDATKKEAARTVPAANDRGIGLKCAVAAAGFVAGQIGLTVHYATA